MKSPRWLASPLAATAGVLAGLSLLAIPLRKLTSAQPVLPAAAPRVAVAAGETPAVLRLRLLAPARRVIVTTAAGKTLLDRRDLVAGETECDAAIPLAGGMLELAVLADCGDAGGETAVFLTVMPDSYDDQTRHAIGRGRFEETLRYEWSTR